MENGSYLLGTHAEELERLQFQNQLWRPTAQDAWQRADLRIGESARPGQTERRTQRLTIVEPGPAHDHAPCLPAGFGDLLTQRFGGVVDQPLNQQGPTVLPNAGPVRPGEGKQGAEQGIGRCPLRRPGTRRAGDDRSEHGA